MSVWKKYGLLIAAKMVLIFFFLTSASLLGEHIDSIVVFHVKASRRVSLINRCSIEAESDLVHVEALSIAVSIHQLFQLSVFLDLKLDNTSVLSADFQVPM